MSCRPTATAGSQALSRSSRSFMSKERSVVVPRPVVPFSRSLRRKVVSRKGSAWKPRNQKRRSARNDVPASRTPSSRKRALRVSSSPTPPKSPPVAGTSSATAAVAASRRRRKTKRRDTEQASGAAKTRTRRKGVQYRPDTSCGNFAGRDHFNTAPSPVIPASRPAPGNTARGPQRRRSRLQPPIAGTATSSRTIQAPGRSNRAPSASSR